MKKLSILFLQGVIALIGTAVLAALIWLPQTEGRAKDLDLFSIYADPFILYGYAASVFFFIALVKAFKLLGYIGRNKIFSASAITSLKSIKHCAVTFAIMIVLAAVYIRLAHHEDDDPAGFIAMCIVVTFAASIVATAAAIFERLLQNALDLKSENDLTI